MKNYIKILIVVLLSVFTVSCVSTRKYKDMKSKNAICNKVCNILKEKNKENEATLKKNEIKIEKFEFRISSLTKRVDVLVEDTARRGKTLRILIKDYNKVAKYAVELDKEILKLKEDVISSSDVNFLKDGKYCYMFSNKAKDISVTITIQINNGKIKGSGFGGLVHGLYGWEFIFTGIEIRENIFKTIVKTEVEGSVSESMEEWKINKSFLIRMTNDKEDKYTLTNCENN